MIDAGMPEQESESRNEQESARVNDAKCRKDCALELCLLPCSVA